MQVIDDQQLRTPCREAGHQPVQTVEHAKRRVRLHRRRSGLRQHDRSRQRGGPGQRPAACGRRHASQPRLEQLPDDAPRVRDFQIGSARAGHRETALLRGIPSQVEDARLADPGRPAHHHSAPVARGHLGECIHDDLQLALSLLQPARHAAESMAAQTRGRDSSAPNLTPLAPSPGHQRQRMQRRMLRQRSCLGAPVRPAARPLRWARRSGLGVLAAAPLL